MDTLRCHGYRQWKIREGMLFRCKHVPTCSMASRSWPPSAQVRMSLFEWVYLPSGRVRERKREWEKKTMQEKREIRWKDRWKLIHHIIQSEEKIWDKHGHHGSGQTGGTKERGKNCIISACGGAELTLKRSTTTHVPVGRWCIFITPATAPHSADAVLVLFALGVRSDSRQNLPKPRNNLPLHIPESTWTCYLWLGSWSALSTLAVSPRPHFGKKKFVLFLQRVIRYILLLFNGFTCRVYDFKGLLHWKKLGCNEDNNSMTDIRIRTATAAMAMDGQSGVDITSGLLLSTICTSSS